MCGLLAACRRPHAELRLLRHAGPSPAAATSGMARVGSPWNPVLACSVLLSHGREVQAGTARPQPGRTAGEGRGRQGLRTSEGRGGGGLVSGGRRDPHTCSPHRGTRKGDELATGGSGTLHFQGGVTGSRGAGTLREPGAATSGSRPPHDFRWLCPRPPGPQTGSPSLPQSPSLCLTPPGTDLGGHRGQPSLWRSPPHCTPQGNSFRVMLA